MDSDNSDEQRPNDAAHRELAHRDAGGDVHGPAGSDGHGAGVAGHPAYGSPIGGLDVAVLRGRSKRAVRDGALVLQSAGIPHAVLADGAGTSIWVSQRDAQRALTELGSYRQENVDWPPARAEAPPLLNSGVEGAAVYVIVVVLMFWLERRVLYGVDWDNIGVLHAERVRAGEIWRPWTALTMHVDATHLISNIVFGTLFTMLAAQALGLGIAWFGTILAGALGNGFEVWVVDPAHRGVGASTAIFGTLGLITAAEWVRRGSGETPWVRRVAPLFGGAVLFGWLGGGGGSDRVDVLAHALGFVFGAALGVVTARFHLAQRLSRRGQRTLALLGLFSIVAAWAAGIALYPPTLR